MTKFKPLLGIFMFGLSMHTGAVSAADSSTNAGQVEPMNVLFIMADNQPAAILGAYGNPDVRTPNINQLASEGVLFTNAFAVNGMCSPTRATLMTGLMPSQHGVHNWLDDAKLDEWPDDWSVVAEYRTLPQTLENRGYQTAMIGKWHMGQPWQASIGYQHWVTFTYGHTLDFWDNTIVDNGETYQITDRHIVDFFTEEAVDYIENVDHDQPFYLQLNFDGPYLNPPTNTGPARNRHYESYLDEDFESFPRVPVNENILDQLLDPDTPAFMKNQHRQSILHHNDPESMANVASQNTIVDDGVGRVLEALKQAGLDQNTLVIYSSDQGNFYGQHGLWQHTIVTTPSNLYEAALNIPLIIRHPGSIAAGETSDLFIGQYDMATTILDYIGIDDVEFENSPGNSFANSLLGESIDWENEVYYEQEESRGVRTPEFAYWKRIDSLGDSELYDMTNDPGQYFNLIADPDYQSIAAELDRKVRSFYEEYSTKKYDLWNGGTAKGSVARPGIFQALHGDQWKTVSESLPPFEE
ncbi:sulfatase-like hydrolase/transferase [Gammaproteobacteria bacterium]|nr:sulfatase-like hydrolase/transferase [Gammaproteobacteria bacterium]